MRRWLNGLVIILLLAGLAPGATAEPADDIMVQNYRKAIEVNPGDVIAHFNLGLALYKNERFDEAATVLERLLTTNPKDRAGHEQVDGPANQLLGILYYNYRQDDDRALQAFSRSLERMPKEADTYYFIGLTESRRKRHAEALSAFEQAVKLGRKLDADLDNQLGLIKLQLGRDREAAEHFTRVLASRPDSLVALENLGLIHHRLGQGDQAIKTLEKLVKLEPGNFNANYLLGLHYFKKKMYPEMVQAYNRAVAVKPDLADAYFNLGMAYFFETQYSKAIEALKKAVALNPQDAEAYNLLGQSQAAAIEEALLQGGTFLAQDEYAAAIGELEKVLAVDPKNARALSMLADARRRSREEFAAHLRQADKWFSINRLDQAYFEYEKAAMLDPGSSEAQAGLRKTNTQMGKLLEERMQQAKAAENLQDFRQARKHYQSVLKLRPDHAQAAKALEDLRAQAAARFDRSFQQAEKEMAQGAVATAIAAYRRAFKAAEVFQDAERQKLAMNGLAKANARRSELTTQLLAEGKKAMEQNNAPGAKTALSQVLALDPQNRAANEMIVKLTGAPAQAKVADEEVKSTYYRGVDFYVNGKIEEAIAEWEKVVRMDPENQDARINIGRAKAKLAAIQKLTQGN